jgi:hypothetical protein
MHITMQRSNIWVALMKQEFVSLARLLLGID